MLQRFTLDDVRGTYKKRDAWWTIFLVDPLAGRLVVPVANRTNITPNQLTILAALLGIGAAASFWQATTWWFIAGAVLFHLSFVIDCMDGKIARLKGTGSYFGVWLDFLFDRVRDLICAIALFGGLERATGQVGYLYLGIIFVSVNLFRYLDAAAVARVRVSMNQAIARTCLEAGVPPTGYLKPPNPDDMADGLEQSTPPTQVAVQVTGVHVPGLQQSFGRRFGWYYGFREWLLKHRVRTHLFSGIEYQMTVLVVAPILQSFWSPAVAVLTILGALLLLLFEATLVAKLWLSTREIDPLLERIRTPGHDARP